MLKHLIEQAERERKLLRPVTPSVGCCDAPQAVPMLPSEVTGMLERSRADWARVRWELCEVDVEVSRLKRLIAKYEACIRNASRRINELEDWEKGGDA